jgi:hypothetical protein
MNNTGTIKKLLIALIIILALFISYLIYQNLPGDLKTFSSSQNLEIQSKLKNLTSSVNQFVPNMRFNHNDISYYLKQGCDENKIEKVHLAFKELEERTKIITFHKQNDEEADIIIFCSDEQIENSKNTFTAGEGGPSKFLNSSLYPIILQGEINLYEGLYNMKCEKPIVELHELSHVFGYDHINNEKSVLYPYFSCDQELGEEIISHMIRLYEVEPQTEIYFKNITSEKSGRYLNFEVLVENQGMINAENVDLIVSATEKIKEFNLNIINIGSFQKLTVSNLKLPSRSTTQVTLKLETSTKEFDTTNNILNLNFE